MTADGDDLCISPSVAMEELEPRMPELQDERGRADHERCRADSLAFADEARERATRGHDLAFFCLNAERAQACRVLRARATRIIRQKEQPDAAGPQLGDRGDRSRDG